MCVCVYTDWKSVLEAHFIACVFWSSSRQLLLFEMLMKTCSLND